MWNLIFICITLKFFEVLYVLNRIIVHHEAYVLWLLKNVIRPKADILSLKA